MKKFMAVFTGTPEAMAKWQALDPAIREKRQQTGYDAWGKWVQTNAKALIDNGSPLGKTKRVDAQGIHDIKNNLAVYVVVEADSHEAAAKIFLNHPHFMQFPGDGIDVMECLPVPPNPAQK